MLTVNVPRSLTVEVKEVGIVTLDTDKWTEEFVLSAVRFACRVKIDAKRNVQDKTDAEKRDLVTAMIAQLEGGEWKQGATVAAKLDETEKQLRQMLSDEFFKVTKKRAQADADARDIKRWETFRDVVMKAKIAAVATDAEELQQLMLKLQERTDAARHSFENAAQRRADAILAATQAIQIDF